MISSKFFVERHPERPLLWWYTRRHVIDMSPRYQRKGGIWSQTDKAYLIDSIINGFDVPKLYLADLKFSDRGLGGGGFEFAVIDGKQRLEAIFEFFDGTLPLNSSFQYRYDPDEELGGLVLDKLWTANPTVASVFEEKILDFMVVTASDDRDISEMFIRLNRNKPLVGAEIRNAGLGRVNELVQVTADHEFFREFISFSTKRAGDINAAGKLLLFEYQGFPTSTKKRDLDEFVNMAAPDEDRLEVAAFRSEATLNAMSQTFLPRDDLLKSAGQLPVYYWVMRTIPDEGQQFIREFLIDFEIRRELSRRALADGRPDVSDSLSRYDVLNRSTNDKGSHISRIEILLSEFAAWLRAQQSALAPQVQRAWEDFRDEIDRRGA
jgi:hypothetical protein